MSTLGKLMYMLQLYNIHKQAWMQYSTLWNNVYDNREIILSKAAVNFLILQRSSTVQMQYVDYCTMQWALPKWWFKTEK